MSSDLCNALAASEEDKAVQTQEAADLRRELLDVKAAHRLCADKMASKDAALNARDRELTEV